MRVSERCMLVWGCECQDRYADVWLCMRIGVCWSGRLCGHPETRLDTRLHRTRYAYASPCASERRIFGGTCRAFTASTSTLPPARSAPYPYLPTRSLTRSWY
eukprot:1526183-Rhodomonas_salina.3